jgi:hypothetical protein
MSYTVTSDVFPAALVVSPATSLAAASIYARNEDLLTAGAKRLEKVRVITLSSPHPTVIVFQDSPQGPRVVFQQPIATFSPAPPRASRFDKPGVRSTHPEFLVQAQNGTTLAYYRTGGCGCGSRLKSFNPFSSLTSIASSQDLNLLLA